ncbi:hypothetical protein KFE25_012782 [Diacronema lutheri]|uniref:Uncharacterized protein n=2 Tax=Diacronema lutheri TaxID=2081491 RepID=A0A8J6C0R8_DIALT|nr:hypothetical protein KFE25_012782 [Diacronema lutheri]
MGSCASREPALLPSAAAGASDRSDASAADERIDTVVTVFDDAVYYWRVLPSAVLFAEWGSYWRIVAGVGEASATRAGVSEHEAERLFSMSLASREKHVDMYVSVTHTVGRWRAHMALLYVRHHAAAAQLSLLCAGICASWALLLRVVFDQRLPALTAVLLLVALPALCYCARLLLGPRLSLGFHAFHHSACVHAARGGRLREAGVRSLGSAIKHAREHVAIWSPGLFGRLWPVVELALHARAAAALSAKAARARAEGASGAAARQFAPRRLTVVPRWLGRTLLFTLLAHALCIGLAVRLAPALGASLSHARVHALAARMPTAREMEWSACVWVGVSGLPLFGLCALLRYRARQRTEAEAQLARFELAKSALSDEADRPLLTVLVLAHWRTVADFEAFVRVELLHTVRAALGPAWALPLSWCLFCSMPACYYGLVDATTQPYALAVRQTRADVPCYALVTVAFHATVGVVCLPLALHAAAASAWHLRALPFALGLAVDWAVLLGSAYALVLLSTRWPHALFAQCAGDNDRFF